MSERFVWGAAEGHRVRHRFVLFTDECAEGDNYDDAFYERPHSRWPNGVREHLLRRSEISDAKRLPRCKVCVYADPEIRELAETVLKVLHKESPNLFEDMLKIVEAV